MSNMKENTDRAEYLAGSRDAAVYMQTYIREQAENFQEMAIETNPNKGWGENKEVHNAHDIAIMLFHYTNENFLNCRIPEDYASPQALNESLENFRIMLIRDKEQLEEDVSRLKSDSPMTLSIVHKNLVSCLHAVDETLAQLADAKAKIPENITTGSIGTTPTPMERIHEIANRFSNVVRRMSTRRKGNDALVINDEYDVQYLFQGLLEVQFDDIRPEEPTPSVGGGSGRVDTLLKNEKIVVEYKCMRSSLTDIELRKQVADDFVLYGNHADCKKLFIFIYDPEKKIKNPKGFEKDLTRKVDGIDEVCIVIKQ